VAELSLAGTTTPRRRNPEVPETVDHAVGRALVKEAARRFQSMEQFAGGLRLDGVAR
jgi:hypothetical protein